jgi:hypothetical protein
MLGIYDSPKTYDMTGNQFVVVPKVFKKRCIPEHTIVYYPIWLLNQMFFKINPDNGVEAIKGMQDAINQFVSWRPNGPSFRNLYRK